MKIDSTLTKAISDTKPVAASIEDAGYDGLWVGETMHDPFLQILQAAEATERITVGSSIAIAFARTPMTLAYSAFDLAQYAKGRFILGLGSQVKPHIERRFSMPWSHPAARMRELVMAIRSIWAAWETGEKLDFQGDFYTHTLMTPFFSPPAHSWGPPPIFLAGVGSLMTEVAGEACDGFFLHPFTTERYLTEVTLPALERGWARAGRNGSDSFDLAGPVFACVGRDDKELATAVKGTKDQIAFYASTPAYRPVLDLHGWGDLQPELTRLSKEGRWSVMGDAIDDEILHEIAVVGGPGEVGEGLARRWGSVASRITLYATYQVDPSVWPDVMSAIRSA